MTTGLQEDLARETAAEGADDGGWWGRFVSDERGLGAWSTSGAFSLPSEAPASRRLPGGERYAVADALTRAMALRPF